MRPAEAWAAATGLDRPKGAAVNVFFAFAPLRALINAAPARTPQPTVAMTKSIPSPVPTLARRLRREIDRIDEAMHGLLMERGEIIDRLIAVEADAGDPAPRSAPRARRT